MRRVLLLFALGILVASVPEGPLPTVTLALATFSVRLRDNPLLLVGVAVEEARRARVRRGEPAPVAPGQRAGASTPDGGGLRGNGDFRFHVQVAWQGLRRNLP